MDLYRELILDHYKHPRNFGHLEKPDVVMEEGNVTCGDRIVMEIKSAARRRGRSSQKSKVIEAIRFNGEGCAISQASASMLTENVKGMKLVQIKKMTVKDIETMLGATLTPSRVRCATLPLEVLHKAIATI